MEKVWRYGAFKLDSTYLDASGFYRAKGTIARIGVQTYYDRKGKRIREFRPPEEVERSAKSFSSQPVTLDHPPYVDASNVQNYLKGYTSEVVYQDGTLQTDLTLINPDAIKAAQTTHQQISCGYYAELEMQPGVWVDEHGIAGEAGIEYPYDAIQRNIVGNHVALVEQARAGAIARIHDSATIIAFEETTVVDGDTPNKNMIDFVHDDVVLKLDGEDAKKIKQVLDNLKESKAKADSQKSLVEQDNVTLKAKLAEVEGKLAATELRLAQAESNHLDADKIEAEVRARLLCLEEIKAFNDNFEPDLSLTAAELRRAYLKDAAPHLADKLKGASDEYVNGVWEGLKPSIKSGEIKKAEKVLETTSRGDSADTTIVSSRKKATDRRANAWCQDNRKIS